MKTEKPQHYQVMITGGEGRKLAFKQNDVWTILDGPSLAECYFNESKKALARVSELERENKELIQWKKEQMEVWGPVLDWFQENKNIPLGTSISKEALRRSQEFERLEKEVETLREVLKDVKTYIPSHYPSLHTDIEDVLNPRTP